MVEKVTCPFCKKEGVETEERDEYKVCLSCGYVISGNDGYLTFARPIARAEQPDRYKNWANNNFSIVKKRASMNLERKIDSKSVPSIMIRSRMRFLDVILSNLHLTWGRDDRKRQEIVHAMESIRYSYKNYGDMIVPCIVLDVCRRNNVPLSMLEVANAAEMTLHELGRKYKVLCGIISYGRSANVRSAGYLDRVVAYAIELGYLQAGERTIMYLSQQFLNTLEFGDIPILSRTFASSKPEIICMAVFILVLGTFGFKKAELQRLKAGLCQKFNKRSRTINRAIVYLKRLLLFFARDTAIFKWRRQLSSAQLEDILNNMELKVILMMRSNYGAFIEDIVAFCTRKGLKMTQIAAAGDEHETQSVDVYKSDITPVDIDEEDLDVDEYIRTDEEIRILIEMRKKNETELVQETRDVDRNSIANLVDGDANGSAGRPKAGEPGGSEEHTLPPEKLSHLPFHHPDLY